jgi:hypothetical protein
MSSFEPNVLTSYSSVVKNYALPQGVLNKYSSDWNTFERIQAYNSNVSTLRAHGEKKTYYTYKNYTEKYAFTNGQYLHTLYYPTSNWNIVQQN